jgi:membrane protein YdbS with pleckstrin-like domain
MLAIKRGWFVEKRVLIPVNNIQSLTLERGPLQRRLGLASLLLDTAGGPATGWRIVNLDHGHARALLNDLRAAASSRKRAVA